MDLSDSVLNIVGTQYDNAGICELMPIYIPKMVDERHTSVEDVARCIFDFLRRKTNHKRAIEERID